MTTDRQGDEPPDRRDGTAGVHTCCRVGMRANPPGLRLSLGWLRRG